MAYTLSENYCNGAIIFAQNFRTEARKRIIIKFSTEIKEDEYYDAVPGNIPSDSAEWLEKTHTT